MSTIQIQPAKDKLIAGEFAQIPILLVVDEPLKVRGLHATFHAAEETQAEYSTYDAATQSTQVHTAVEHVDIVKSEFLLTGNERKGFFSNLADGFATLLGGGEHEVLEPGEHPFEVEVQIPADARPSFEGEKCRVFYELSAVVDVPAGRDLTATHSFSLAVDSDTRLPEPEPVRTRYPDDQASGLFDAWLKPDIQVEAALKRSTFREGETIEGIFSVETPKPLKFKAINVCLITIEKTTAESYEDEYTHVGPQYQIVTDGIIEDSFAQRIEIQAARPGPASAEGSRFSITSFLQIQLDVPWAKDPTIHVPVSLEST